MAHTTEDQRWMTDETRRLARALDLKYPLVIKWLDGKQNRHIGRNETHTIVYGASTHHTKEASVWHEVAHALHHERNAIEQRRDIHGYGFYQCLLDVIHAAGGLFATYPWHQEYKGLWQRAIDDGHTAIPKPTLVSPSFAGLKIGGEVRWRGKRGERTGRVLSFGRTRVRARANDDNLIWTIPVNCLIDQGLEDELLALWGKVGTTNESD